MIRGTTPKHTFILPFHTDLIKKVYVTYKQEVEFGKSILLEKGKDDSKQLNECTLDGYNVIVELKQEETLTFIHGIKVEIQLTVIMEDANKKENRYTSNIIVEDIDKILKEDII